MTDPNNTDLATDGSKRPAWLIPAAIGLTAGLIIALVAVVLTRDDADDAVETDDAVTTTIEPETTVEPAVTEPVDTTETTLAPDTTLGSETTVAPEVPATAAPTTPAATTAPAPAGPTGITAASPGTVRLGDQEYPIVRECAWSKLAGLQVISWLFFDEFGFPEIIEQFWDEGGEPYGVYRGESDAVTDLGDNGFGFTWFESDGPGVPLSVNPGSVSTECPGSVTLTDPTIPEAFNTDLIVDVCFGTHNDGASGSAFGYRARTQDGGEFTADPNAGSSFAVSYNSPYFGADDDSAEATGDATTTGFEGVLVGNPDGSYAGQTRQISATFTERLVRDCTDVD